MVWDKVVKVRHKQEQYLFKMKHLQVSDIANRKV